MRVAVCEECGRDEVEVRDLGLRRPLSLCADCLAGAVAAWHAQAPPTIGQILDDVRHGRHTAPRPPPDPGPAGRRRPPPDAEAS